MRVSPPLRAAAALNTMKVEERLAIVEFLVRHRYMDRAAAEKGLVNASLEELDRVLIEMNLYRQLFVGQQSAEYNPYA